MFSFPIVIETHLAHTCVIYKYFIPYLSNVLRLYDLYTETCVSTFDVRINFLFM